jgi:hypothetical protein
MRLILLLILAAFVSSCDTKKDPIKFKDQDPIFTINKGLNNWNSESEFVSYFEDSVKVNKEYLIEYKLEDESSILLTETKNIHLGVFELDNENLIDIEGLPTGQKTIELKSSELGVHNLGFKVIDNYSQVKEVSFDLTVFFNLKPTAIFTVTENNINQQYQYIIDGSNSFDRDSKYGGAVMQYQLIVNNDSVTSFSPKFDYYFAGQGNYTIGMRCLDNDNEWGSVKQVSYNVN